ncbi:MAG: hypothetical protein ACE5JU_24480 [Candidatus Binatia bacterium]
MRLALTVVLAGYGLICLRDPTPHRLIDSVDLVIHEAGHVLFGPFGEFLGFLGGTLMQLILPAAFVGYFMRQGDRHAASVSLWWVAQNLWNISVYVRDARSQALPLIGGEHDWAYLLGRLNLLDYDQVLGRTIYFVGVLIFLYAIVVGIVLTYSESGWRSRTSPG